MTEPNTLTAEEQAAGFRLLFDGKTTENWRGYRRDAIYPQWQVIDGALTNVPDENPEYGHDIISVDTFTNFELRLDWALWTAGNSGVMYHVRETADWPFETGPEIQLLDDVHHPDARNGPARHMGGCYGLYPPLENTVITPGEWNPLKLVVDSNNVQHFSHGKLVAQYVLGSADWNERVRNSKFAAWPGFASERHGHICLQDHRDRVAFRNIRIRAF